MTYGGITLEEMHDTLHRLPFAESTAALSENVHGEGWSLAITLMLGAAAAIVLLASSFRDTVAVFASVSLATGRQGRLTQQPAATHDHRQGGWWAIQGLLRGGQRTWRTTLPYRSTTTERILNASESGTGDR